MWKKILVSVLKNLLERLEDSNSPQSLREKSDGEHLLKEHPRLESRPAPSRVKIPATSENPRPQLGREKYREQLHLAYCCTTHGCCFGDHNCPVIEFNEPSYFRSCC